MEKHLKEDFDYWIGMSGVGGEAVNRQELKPFLTILKEKYLDVLRKIQKLEAEKSLQQETFFWKAKIKI